LHLPDTITRIRAPLISGGYGNSSRDWANATSTVFSVRTSFKSVTEIVGDEAQTVTQLSVFGGPDLDLETTDRVVYRGKTYEVAGEVMTSVDGRGQLHHVRARLNRFTTAVS
jgi:hypothetical protein